jgi:hypothetical protein
MPKRSPDSSPSYNNAIYILGAGFSKPAGLPVADELWKEVVRRALPMSERAAKFRTSLENYTEYQRRCFGKGLTIETVNFEQFCGYLDIEHHLGLLGSDTWSAEGNEAQVIIKTLIGQILTERTPSSNTMPQLYIDFAKQLKPYDRILTFNYDILFERALDAAGVPYRLYPDRYETVHRDGSGTIDWQREEVVVLKMHGSVDWFDKTTFNWLQEDARFHGHHGFVPHDAIFNSNLRTTPLVEGPRPHDDPIANVHRLVDVEAFYRNPALFLSTPRLINPSTAKVVYASRFSDFWRGLNFMGGANFRMVIIGYSLPEHDDYARQVIYEIVDNYQRVPLKMVSVGILERDPLLIVDLRRDDAAIADIKSTYSFVDWSRAELHLDGFGPAVLDWLRERE